MISLEHIHKYYNPGTVHELCLFEDFSLTIEKGQFVSIVGSNGSGKIYLTNVGNEASVTAAEQNAAGLIGVSSGRSVIFFRISAPTAGCVLITAYSSSVSRPGLLMMASGTPILPTS